MHSVNAPILAARRNWFHRAGQARLGKVLLILAMAIAVRCGGDTPGPNPSPDQASNPGPGPTMTYDCCTKDAAYYSCPSQAKASSCVSGFTASCMRDATSDTAKCGKKIGDSCMQASQCHDNLCVFRGGAAVGICTRQCTAALDCPFPSSNWTCDYAGGISMKVCLPK